MRQKIGWLNGSWDSLNELKIPINDRGLNFGDGIFETVLILNKKPQLLTAHLDRWKSNAKKLGMAIPPSQETLEPIINEVLEKPLLDNGKAALRLNWSRGSNEHRGINFNVNKRRSEYSFWIELAKIEPSFEPVTTIIDNFERRNANSLISQCKTFNYMQSVHAKFKAMQKKFDDALLLSTTGEMCCSTTANIIVQRNGSLLTPRLASGCMPGIMRQQGINKGLLQEVVLSSEPSPNDQWLLINSLSCHPIAKINNQSMQIYQDSESLWNLLLIE